MRPAWRCYLATIDGVDAGGAMLHVSGSIASLAGAATAPEMRGCGCQTALLRYRIVEARRLGCTTVISRCAADSTSERNLVHAGLWRAFSKVVWYPQPG
jgi:GNAT superfamily N-acetyltransferase